MTAAAVAATTTTTTTTARSVSGAEINLIST
jgi:hypothetical protein